IWARVKTMTQWAMTRELRRRVKQILDNHGIQVAFPRRLLVLNQPGMQGAGVASGAAFGTEQAAPMEAVPGRIRTVAPPTGRPGAVAASEEGAVEGPGPGPDMAPQPGTRRKR